MMRRQAPHSAVDRHRSSSAAAAETSTLPLSESKVVTCVLLAFGDRPDLERSFQAEHAAERVRYDAIRALLRLSAWMGFAVRAAACSGGRAAALMALASVVYALAPLALLAFQPAAFLSWRCVLISAWNVGHAAMTAAFLPQLHALAPAPAAPAPLWPPGGALGTLRALLWLLWHSQAAMMALNASFPLVNTFRHFVQGQLLVLLLNVRLTRHHCAANPTMLAAVAAVHARLVRPAAAAAAAALRPLWPAALASASASAGAGEPAAPVALCAYYLPALQLGLGLLLPAALVYRHERGLRRRFLAARGARLDAVGLRREMGAALLATALQLAAWLTLEASGVGSPAC